VNWVYLRFGRNDDWGMKIWANDELGHMTIWACADLGLTVGAALRGRPWL